MSPLEVVLLLGLILCVLLAPVLAVVSLAPFTRDGRVLSTAVGVTTTAIVLFMLSRARSDGSEIGASPAFFVILGIVLLPGLLLGALAALVASSRAKATG